MRIAVSAYCYARLVAAGDVALADVPAMVRAAGVREIEFTTLRPPPGTTLAGHAAAIRQACDRAGVSVAAYAVTADFLAPARGDWQAEAARLEEQLDVARTLGTRLFRHDASAGFPGRALADAEFAEALPVLAAGCRAVTEHAVSRGIRTMVENHGFFCQDSARIERLVEAVGHPNFAALVDIGNFLCADEDPVAAVERLAPRAVHVHAKDFHCRSPAGGPPDTGADWFRSRGGSLLRGAILGQGDVPVAACLQVLARAGYDGCVCLEFEGPEDPRAAVPRGLENLRGIIGAVR